ncbi:phosphonate metabolism protein PhnM [Raoultella ornithinolytica]|nr:phosphonate metabolism protein PhnM [Raoultella ornithinolytica]
MIINNVNLVLEDEVVHGSLEVQEGRIYAFAESQSQLPQALDGEGGWLLPGLIELHTDNLDKFFTPRPKVDWPAHSAMSSHDALMIASGITTVLDAVAIGDVRDGGDRLENLEKMINAIEETQKRGVNRAEHRLHLRCELPHHTTLPLFEKLVGREPVSMVSLMDHSPGQRQYADSQQVPRLLSGKISSDQRRDGPLRGGADGAGGDLVAAETARPSPPSAASVRSPSPATMTPPVNMSSKSHQLW